MEAVKSWCDEALLCCDPNLSIINPLVAPAAPTKQQGATGRTGQLGEGIDGPSGAAGFQIGPGGGCWSGCSNNTILQVCWLDCGRAVSLWQLEHAGATPTPLLVVRSACIGPGSTPGPPSKIGSVVSTFLSTCSHIYDAHSKAPSIGVFLRSNSP